MDTETSDAVLLCVILIFVVLFSAHQVVQFAQNDWPENVARLSSYLREEIHQSLEETL